MGEAWKAAEASPIEGHVHEKENKRCFSKHTIHFGRPCKEIMVLWGGMLLGLEVSPEAGVGEGDKEGDTGASRCLQDYGVPQETQIPIREMFCGAGATQEGAVGSGW